MQWVRGALSPGLKRPGRSADHSPPSNAEVKNAWSSTSNTPYVFMAWCLVKYMTLLHGVVLRHRDNINLQRCSTHSHSTHCY